MLDLDQDGWPGFIVTRNNSTTLAFRNNGVAGHRPLRVVLHGPAGNPTAVGARITSKRRNVIASATPRPGSRMTSGMPGVWRMP